MMSPIDLAELERRAIEMLREPLLVPPAFGAPILAGEATTYGVGRLLLESVRHRRADLEWTIHTVQHDGGQWGLRVDYGFGATVINVSTLFYVAATLGMPYALALVRFVTPHALLENADEHCDGHITYCGHCQCAECSESEYVADMPVTSHPGEDILAHHLRDLRTTINPKAVVGLVLGQAIGLRNGIVREVYWSTDGERCKLDMPHGAGTLPARDIWASFERTATVAEALGVLHSLGVTLLNVDEANAKSA